ncbi:hypothetical protein GCM10010387_36840 [Streptomyces inusitatus]|uniref:Uncharacterized protein n=1 Tax=Streptomyces inusitatus TaxID=68221 RepID=A0A918QAQ4_9ACTN|nr:hypothetical protein GCM10010387_36840 [Streptomyces inusitatus]
MVVTGLAVAVLAGGLSFLSWDRADQLAGVVSALVGVAGLGTAVYAVLLADRPAAVEVSRTGRAVARGGDANTGVIAPASGSGAGPLSVSDTGDARADGGGSANTGYRQS